jgi:hypothetical protein
MKRFFSMDARVKPGHDESNDRWYHSPKGLGFLRASVGSGTTAGSARRAIIGLRPTR